MSSSRLCASSDESEKVTYVPMPNVRGRKVEEVRNELKDLGIKSEVEYQLRHLKAVVQQQIVCLLISLACDGRHYIASGACVSWW